MSTSIRSGVRALLTSLLVLGTVGTARAADRFVSPAGSDAANDCTSNVAPCQTLARGLTQAGSGDTIKVAGGLGLYTEHLLIDFSITLTLSGGWGPDFATRDPHEYRTTLSRGTVAIAAGAGQSVDIGLHGLRFAKEPISVQGSADGAIQVAINDCRISGKEGTISASHGGSGALDLNLTGSTITGIGADIYAPDPVNVAVGGSATASVTVQESTFTHCKGGALALRSSSTGAVSLSVDRSVFANNKTASFPCCIFPDGAGATIFVTGDRASVTMTNSAFTHNISPSYASPWGSRGAALKILGEGGPTGVVTLVNDTIVGNQSVGLLVKSTTAGMTNVIVWGNHPKTADAGDLQLEAGAVVDADHDDIGVVGAGSDPFTDLGGNVSVDPGRLKGGFKLPSTSPLIDAGTCAGAPPTDIDGDPRPSGPGCDIGADEFVP